MATGKMDEYLTARQQADAYAQSGMKAEALAQYDKAIALLPETGFSPSQLSLLVPLLNRRRERVANGE